MNKPAYIIEGYKVYAEDLNVVTTTLTEDYSNTQQQTNIEKTHGYLVPILESHRARRVLEVGCGVGTMVEELNGLHFDAYGVDIYELLPFWKRLNRNQDRFAVIDAINTRLPFENEEMDFVYSFGVIEHVGHDGYPIMPHNCHEVRKKWLLELLRVVRKGGSLLIGGPSRRFPFDTWHAGETATTTQFEQYLWRRWHIPYHNPFSDRYYMTAYKDIRTYLAGVDVEIEPLSIAGYLQFSSLPPFARGVFDSYCRLLPRFLRDTGFNFWVMALIKKTDS
ncbi:MAG: class I SAM-dependent methyltransferase [Desulfuromonadaceae bacterium]